MMTDPKPMLERERELQALMLTPDGPAALERLADEYATAGGTPRARTSVITYILVHERVRGQIQV
jgi:hypothetical protein